MQIGIGLPNPIPGTPGGTLIRWARRGEEAGFSSLATIDRIVYPSYESLLALAAAAGVTERIGLMTNVLLGPTRNPVLLAKESASVDQVSGGRLTLGLGVGARKDDFEAAGLDFHTRGKRWDRDLELIHRAWRGEPMGAGQPVGPRPVQGDRVPIMIGGASDPAIDRVVKWGIGWTMGGGAAEQGAPFAERVRMAWKDAGREGQPRIVALTYFALGEGAAEKGAAYLSDYYGPYGPRIAQAMPTSPQQMKETVSKFEGYGFDELFFDPTVADLAQIDRVAEAVL
jgi:alkanesulfonate monooxygenase SsuD/methylene tetrahydromethanopterin reductase-like flavin-dependent oxidoreductase (luciferase family)